MPRIVTGSLIQAAVPITDPAAPFAKSRFYRDRRPETYAPMAEQRL